MEKEEVLNDFKYFNRCVQLLKIRDKDLTKEDLADCTGDRINHMNFCNLIKFLISEDFIRVDNSRIPYIYKINKNKLSYFLRESNFFKDFGLIVENTMSAYRY